MKPKLKYLFFAEFVDGTNFKQTPDDISSIDPEKRSQFYDLLQCGKTIRRFSLVGDGNTITVDLGNGIFYVNGLAVLLESEKLPCLPDKFTLIFYRQWTQNLNVTYDTTTKEELKREPLTPLCEYYIGWQCLIKGKNFQQKMAII